MLSIFIKLNNYEVLFDRAIKENEEKIKAGS